MATQIPRNKFIDQRTSLAQDLAQTRQITLNLQKKAEPISDAQWREHQLTLYPDLLMVSNHPSLANLLANNLETTNQSDSLQLENLGMSNLITITDQETANYIMDRLDDVDIDYMNQNFPTILKLIKTKYSKMNKDKFIEIVKSQSTEIPVYDITSRGKKRQIALKQQQDEYEELLDNPRQESELRAMREHDRLLKPKETGVKNPVERDALNFGDVYPERNFSPQKNLTPKKLKGDYGKLLSNGDVNTTNDDEEEALSEIKNEIKNLKTKDLLKGYISGFTHKSIPAGYNKDDLIIIATRLGYNDKMNIKTGSGFRRRLILGRGSPQNTDSDSEDEEENKIDKSRMLLNNDKFGINLNKLRKNILHVFYVTSRASIPSLKREHISSDCRDVILDILSNKFNERLFNKLPNDDQRLVSTFVRVMKIKEIDMNHFDTEYQNRYDILMGEINAGNDNPKIKQELKLYILRGMSENLIPKHQGQTMLFNLSL